MNILITGCAGYIGTVLTPHLLQEGHSVRGFDSLLHGGEGMLGFIADPHFTFVKGDARNTDLVRQSLKGASAVIHLAALVGEPQCAQDESVTKQVNVEAVRSLLSLSKEAHVSRFLFASTCSNYGVHDPDEKATESSILNPQGLYAETKCKAERLILSSDLSTVVMRFATVFGLSPRMRFDLLLNELCRDAVCKRYLDVWGPDSWRPFVHVRDLARCIAILVEYSGYSGIYNVGGKNAQKSGIAMMLKGFVPGLEVDYTTGKVDPRDYRVSFDKLGLEMQYHVSDGIGEMVSALRDGVFDDPFSRRHRNV